MIRIKLHANWCSDYEIREQFNKCTKNNDYIWKDLYITLENDYDYFIIFNHPRHLFFNPEKTIIFQSEPEITRKMWGAFYKPDKNIFFRVFDIENHHNLDKWYINMNYKQLKEDNFRKTKTISGIISSFNYLEGHQDRLNFAGILDNLPFYEHFGRGNLSFLKSYKGQLSNKQDGLINYKYHFNAENSYENNYFTEKIIDPILCECLCFYSGCPNIEKFIDENSYIKIDIKNPEKAFDIVKSSIKNNEYEKRIDYIKKAKKKLMDEQNPLNIIYNIIKPDSSHPVPHFSNTSIPKV